MVAYRSVATGFGIRLDAGTAYSPAPIITRHYDSAAGQGDQPAARSAAGGRSGPHADRAIREFRIRGVVTNLTLPRRRCMLPRGAFKSNELHHQASSTTTPDLFQHFPRKRDRATRLLTFHRRGNGQRQPCRETKAARSRITGG